MFQPVPQVLQHASYVPAEPARLVSGGLFGPPIELTLQIGEGSVVTYTPQEGDDIAAFLARIVSSGTAVDEAGKNPLKLTISDRYELTSGARIRGSGPTFAIAFGSMNVDASPAPARVYDTDSDHTRHADGSVGEAISALDARVEDPFTIVRGNRRHPQGVESTLVALGAVLDEQINVSHGDEYDLFNITADATAGTFVDWINASPALNPSGPSTSLRAYRDPLFETIVITSQRRQPPGIFASTVTLDALFRMPAL